MNASWMLSSVMVSLLIGAAALCVERVLTLRRGTPVRWVWITAIALSIGWSGRWLLPSAPTPVAPEPVPSVSSVLPDAVVISGGVNEAALSPKSIAPASRWTTQLATVRAPELSEQAERRLRLASFGMSVALLIALAWSNTRLMRDRRRWRATSLLNTDVLVSEGFGPAIVGMHRPAIVVPPWVLAVETSAQRTILLHENEHRRAGDQWLLLASFGALVLAPWNVVIWFMRRRLARTIELDCDERVLAHGVADVDYANVLLSAWQLARGAMPWVPSPALAEHVSRLGRRVEHLMRPVPRRRLMKTIGGVCTSVLLIGAAVFVPAPQQAQSRPLPGPQPAQMPSVPTPQTAPSPSVPAPKREQVPSLPAPVAAPIPSVPAPVAAPIPSVPAPSPSPSVPTPSQLQIPSIPAPVEPGAILQKRARLVVVAPWDSASATLVNAVHELLAKDLLGKPVDMISRSVFVTSASAAGFQPNGSLRVKLETDSKGFAPPDVKKLGELVRADLVIGLQVRQAPGFVHIYASVIAPGDSAPHRILDGDGSVDGISKSLIRALHNDPAYLRVQQPQTDATNGVNRSAVVVPATVAAVHPAELRLLGLSGGVVARFVVDTNGRVDESTITILASDRPEGSIAVRQTLRSLTFPAADPNGVKMRQEMAFQVARDGLQTIAPIAAADTTMRILQKRVRQHMDSVAVLLERLQTRLSSIRATRPPPGATAR